MHCLANKTRSTRLEDGGGQQFVENSIIMLPPVVSRSENVKDYRKQIVFSSVQKKQPSGDMCVERSVGLDRPGGIGDGKVLVRHRAAREPAKPSLFTHSIANVPRTSFAPPQH